MIQTASGYVEVENGQLYYEMDGQGEPLVLSHALFLDSRMFDPLWPILTQHYQVIRYDLHGFGRSDAAHSPVERRADLRQLLDRLQIPRAHWVGCSNSGQLMLDLALEEPSRVRSLTLVGSTPSGFEMHGEMPPLMGEMFAAFERGDIDQANTLQIRIWLDGEHRTPEILDPTLRAKALAMNRIPVERRTFFTADWEPANPLQPSAIQRLGDVQCPTLIVAGTLDHPAVLEASELIAKMIPNARKELIEGAGHVPSYEQPERFASLLMGFLKDTAA